MSRLPLSAVLTTTAATALALLTAVPASAAPTPDAGGPAEILRYVGDASSATGNAISNGPCDVNGDDHDDAVVGAWFWDKTPNNNIGAAYVLLGGDAVAGGPLADPTAVGAVRIDGPTDDPRSVGFSVGCLGDVNGDGYDDLGVGDYLANQAYVIFGRETFTGLSLDALGDRGFRVREPFTAAADRSNLSFSMSAVGDIDDDGKGDFAIAAVVADTRGRTNNGRVTIVRGRDDISDLDLSAPGDGVLLTVDGALSEERLGSSAAVGDVNGDGIDDFLLGSYTSTPWGASVAVPGAAYVVFGGTTGALDAGALGSKGFTIRGPQRQRDRLGISVSAAGDVNRDGKADLLIGADGVNNAATGPRTGGAALVYGSAAVDTVYTNPAAPQGQSVYTCAEPEALGTTCAAPIGRGYWINGEVNQDSFGYSVAGIGDVNGDAVPDVAVGAWGYDPVVNGSPASSGGATYVLFGGSTAPVQSTAGLSESRGYRIEGLKAGDRFGRQVGLIGDFDDNGVRDVVAAGDFASRTAATGAQNGEVAVLLMGRLAGQVALTGPSRVRNDEDATFAAAVTKKVGDQAPLSEGTVTFTLGDAVLCDEVPVAAGAATCTRTGDLSETSGDVVATFDGGDRLAEATSAPLAFTAAKDPSTTTLTVSDLDPRAGQLVQLTAEVDAAEEPAATGTVSFTADGTTITACGRVSVTDGVAQCLTSWPRRSQPEVRARYAGTDVVASSASGAMTVDVGATSAIRPDEPPAVTYGRAAKVTGEIVGADGTPTGTIELKKGATVLSTATLDDGEFTLPIGATQLTPGSHTLTLAYSGDDRTKPGERTLSVTVARAAAKVSVSASPSSLKAGARSRLTVVVTATGVTPTGTARIDIVGAASRTVKLTNGRGSIDVQFNRKGARQVTAVYGGSPTVSTATSAAKTVTVK